MTAHRGALAALIAGLLCLSVVGPGLKTSAEEPDPPSGPESLACGVLPGDCDSNGNVAIPELQKAVNMSLGSLQPGCNVDQDGSGTVSAQEVDSAARAHLGLLSTALGVKVAISPSFASLATGGTQKFSGALLGCGESTAVTWSVQEGASGGTITPAGDYTAPATAGTYHVVATGQADASRSAVATVSVTARTLLVQQTVQPSSSDQTVEADSGAVALLIPGDLLSAAVTVAIERVTGVPSPPAQFTLKSSWYRISVDGQGPPGGTSVVFNSVPSPASAEKPREFSTEDLGTGIVSYDGGSFGSLPSTYQSGSLYSSGMENSGQVYAATWKVYPIEKVWDSKPHFTIHYYESGDDAVPTDYQAEHHDEPAIPDFVEDVGAYLERAYDRYTAAPPAGFGLIPPYTAAQKAQVHIGDYSSSEWSKWDGSICVANKFNSKTELGPNWEAVGGLDRTLLQWEMAHELFHAVQNKYRTIGGMGSVLWLTESLADYAAHAVTPDSQKLMDVHLVNYGNWLNYQYWDSSAGDQTKYLGAGFFDYEAERYPAGFGIDAEFMEKEYTSAYSQAGALDALLNRHHYYLWRFPEWIEYFYFDETSPLAQLYFPVTKKQPKSAFKYRNGTMGCPKPASRYAYETDAPGLKLFTLGGAGGLKPWTGDYAAVLANSDTGLPTNAKVWTFKVAMKTDLGSNEVAKLFFSKEGRITGPGQSMPPKNTPVEVELGRSKAADAFYVLVVNPNSTGSPATAHQVQVTPGLAITNANGYNQAWPYLFCIGTPVSFQVQTVGGAPPYQFSLVDGALPDGCALNPSTGLITGSLSGDASSFHNFRVQVKDSLDDTATGDFSVMACRNTDTFVCTMCWY